jgi:hypothetical protein
MGLAAWTKKIDKKVGWGFVGAVLAILFGIPAIQAWWFPSRPMVVCEIGNEANVLDIHQSLKDLSITFKGENIQEKNLNLKIVSVRIDNRGDLDILQNHYDERLPFALSVQDGKIIEARLAQASSEYLNSNVNPVLQTNNTVSLQKVILERGKFYVVEMLILHPKENSPKIHLLGKIAGIERLDVVRPPLQSKSGGFLNTTFGGNWITQITRVVCYFVLGIALLVALIFIASRPEHIRTKARNRREKQTRDWVNEKARGDSSPYLDVILAAYNERGIGGVRRLKNLLENKDELLVTLLLLEADKEHWVKRTEIAKKEFVSEKRRKEIQERDRWRSHLETEALSALMSKRAVGIKADGGVYVTPEVMHTLSKVMDLHSQFHTERDKDHDADDWVPCG